LPVWPNRQGCRSPAPDVLTPDDRAPNDLAPDDRAPDDLAPLTGPALLRGWVAPSRVVFGPIETNLGTGRALSDRHTAFYASRAAGGAGVIVTEIASVHESDWPYERAPLAASCAQRWAAVVAACRPYRSLVLAGLGHAGGQGVSAYHQRVLWAPSGVADVVTREVAYAVEQPEIDELVAGFAAAASLAVRAGCAGVELNAGQHSLLRQFLSGLTNRRSDGYGEDRGRLLREVLAAVRAAMGPVAVLGLRLCADELAPWGGITPADAAALVPSLAPLLDYLVPVRGCALSESATRPDGHTEPGFNRALCTGVRAALRGSGSAVPVVLQGSVVDPAMASSALVHRTAELVEMTRAQLADPRLVSLARAGLAERIRPATLSNQHSRVRGPENLVISDEGEPDTGYEARLPRPGGHLPAVSAPPRRVLVVGGGPAGLEAARVAALRGYRVRLVERADRLGGAARLAAALPGRTRFGLLLDWWERELARLRVDVRTGVQVGVGELDAAAGEGLRVLLCTGSRPAPPAFAVGSGVDVLPAAEFQRLLLGGGAAGLGRAVVHDPVGDWTGVGIAEQLAASGVDCALVTPDPVAGVQLSRTGDLADANARLQRAGVARELYTALCSAGDGAATLVDVHTGERRRIRCDVVVDCAQRLPDDTLWLARPHLARAGDCVAPRTVREAVLEGREWRWSL
jgi:2,4-dienoyl-CoA reductase (NADPH2)